MKEFTNFNETTGSVREAKKAAFSVAVNALQELILQRFQALITISSVSFAVIGIILSTKDEIISHKPLAVLSAGIFIFVALVSLGRHLYLIRKDIVAITKRIKDLPTQDWSRPFKEETPKADWWPETMYFLLVSGVIFFGLSLLK